MSGDDRLVAIFTTIVQPVVHLVGGTKLAGVVPDAAHGVMELHFIEIRIG